MKKSIKKSGNSFYIRITSDEMRDYNLKPGDLIDIELCKIKRIKR